MKKLIKRLTAPDMKKFLGRYFSIALPITCAVIVIMLVPMHLYPQIVHSKHSYNGYTYYISRFNDYEELDAEHSYVLLLGNCPDYTYILDSFYKDGYALYFDDKPTFDWMLGPKSSKLYSAAVRFNCIRTKIKFGMFINTDSDFFDPKIFFHELSHYVDTKLGNISKSEEFARIYEEEYSRSILKDDDYYKDIREYFAEESAYYILWKSGKTEPGYDTYETVPKTFTFIEKSLEDIRE